MAIFVIPLMDQPPMICFATLFPTNLSKGMWTL